MHAFAEQHDSEEETPQAVVEVEEDRVARWRFDQFRALGFDNDDAFLLALAPVDLQAARTLIAEGCSVRLALRILL
jgi:hypothetical protein